jgi:ribonucleotide monophosphatase NagD (HAD superfamily)
MSKTISSFKEVELTNGVKTLILCDIDGTILHFPDCDNFCKEFIKEICPLGPTDPTYYSELENMKNMYTRVRPPTHTDYDGFVSILDNIKKMEGKLVFLTARSRESGDWTKKQLKQIGINPEDFEIHYTGSIISKGEYIQKHIDLTGWEHVIFIDDYESFIKSVKDLHPQIVCYKFEAK